MRYIIGSGRLYKEPVFFGVYDESGRPRCFEARREGEKPVPMGTGQIVLADNVPKKLKDKVGGPYLVTLTLGWNRFHDVLTYCPIGTMIEYLAEPEFWNRKNTDNTYTMVGQNRVLNISFKNRSRDGMKVTEQKWFLVGAKDGSGKRHRKEMTAKVAEIKEPGSGVVGDESVFDTGTVDQKGAAQTDPAVAAAAQAAEAELFG